MSDETFIYIVFWLLRFLLIAFIAAAARRYYLGRSSESWPVVVGTVVSSDCELFVNPSAGDGYIPSVAYTYVVNGKEYRSDRINFSLNQGAGNRANAEFYTKRYRKGNNVEVRYNPRRPEQAVLEPGMNNTHFFTTLLLGVVCLGGTGFATYIF